MRQSRPAGQRGRRRRLERLSGRPAEVRPRRQSAFTTIDLLVVVVMVILAVGLIWPMVGEKRLRALRQASRVQMGRIEQACEAYAGVYRHYPGYFDEKMWQRPAFRNNVTGGQNLLISLRGAVTTDRSGPGKYTPPGQADPVAIDLARMYGQGNGERGGSGRRSGNTGTDSDGISGTGSVGAQDEWPDAFYRPRPGEVALARAGGVGRFSPLPSLVDVASGVPLLYFRARRQAKVPVNLWLGAKPQLMLNTEYVRLTDRRLAGADGHVYNQAAHSLIYWRTAGSKDAAAANLAMVAVDPAASDLAGGPSVNHANDPEDRVTARAVLLAAGWDGLYLAQRQNNLRQPVIAKRSDLSLFDDVVGLLGAAEAVDRPADDSE
jgi:type II secretory pathway pseudopilin PulG